MNIWPDDYTGNWTLAKSVVRKGIGLHSGKESEVRLFPSDKPGFQVSWTNKIDTPLPLIANQIRNSPLCTTLDLEGNRLSTVEHLMAALAGVGLTHIHFQVSGEEIPLLDGSSQGWIEAIEEVGIVPAKTPKKKPPLLKNSIFLSRGESVICATPSERFKLVGMIDFSYKAIGQQIFAIELSPKKFVKEIAPARTFGFMDQLDQLKKSGLIKGGSLDNALVCDGDSWINPPLRFKDEPVRHKLLDLIGDLALVGFPNAQILVYKGSHALHADLAAALLKDCPTPECCLD